jgi:hypothetical protein
MLFAPVMTALIFSLSFRAVHRGGAAIENQELR